MVRLQSKILVNAGGRMRIYVGGGGEEETVATDVGVAVEMDPIIQVMVRTWYTRL